MQGKVDPDQIEQAVINVLRNAVDAALPTGGAVFLSLTSEPARPTLQHWTSGQGQIALRTVERLLGLAQDQPEQR